MVVSRPCNSVVVEERSVVRDWKRGARCLVFFFFAPRRRDIYLDGGPLSGGCWFFSFFFCACWMGWGAGGARELFCKGRAAHHVRWKRRHGPATANPGGGGGGGGGSGGGSETRHRARRGQSGSSQHRGAHSFSLLEENERTSCCTWHTVACLVISASCCSFGREDNRAGEMRSHVRLYGLCTARRIV